MNSAVWLTSGGVFYQILILYIFPNKCMQLLGENPRVSSILLPLDLVFPTIASIGFETVITVTLHVGNFQKFQQIITILGSDLWPRCPMGNLVYCYYPAYQNLVDPTGTSNRCTLNSVHVQEPRSMVTVLSADCSTTCTLHSTVP